MDQEQTTPAPAENAQAAPKPERPAYQDRPSGPMRARKDDEDDRGPRKTFGGPGGGKDARGGRGRRRRKVSYLTVNKIKTIDYKDTNMLRRFTNEQGKIVSSRQTGASSKEQRMISTAIRRAREMALIPFVALDSSIGDRGMRGDRGDRGDRRGGYRSGGGGGGYQGGGGGGYQGGGGGGYQGGGGGYQGNRDQKREEAPAPSTAPAAAPAPEQPAAKPAEE